MPLVATPKPAKFLLSLDSPSSLPDHHHGRIRRRLGLPIFLRSSRFRPLVSEDTSLAYQCKGVTSSFHCPLSRDVHSFSVSSDTVGQHDGSSLHKSPGDFPFICSPQSVREYSSPCSPTFDLPVSNTPGRHLEQVGGRLVPPSVLIGGVASQAIPLRAPHTPLRDPPNRSFRDERECSSPPLPLALPSDSCGRPRRICGELEPMVSHLSLPSSTNGDHAEGSTTTRELSRPSTPCSPEMGSPALGPNTSQVVPQSPPSRRSSSDNRPGLGVREIIESSRMEFLALALQRVLPDSPVDDILAGHRASTIRQYQSSWKKFQSFLKDNNTTVISKSTPLQFAAWLFHSQNRACATISSHLAAIADPLRFAFGVSPDPRALELMKSSFFLRRPPPRPAPPSWSLQRVLTHLESMGCHTSATQESLFQRSLFLLSLSSGLRVSQLAALSADSPLLHFGDDDSYVSLAPHPRFLAKNERERHRLVPVTVPAWRVDESHHLLCPVGALRAYLTSDPPPPGGRIWRWPGSNRPCSSSHLAAVICKVIREADPESSPRAHQVRGIASTLAFLRSFDLSQVREAGQWASSRTFVDRYLRLPLQDIPCVALCSGPSTDVGHLPIPSLTVSQD